MQQQEFNPNLYFLAFTREELASIIDEIELPATSGDIADKIIDALERLSD